jgi:hypothetical protein
MVHFFDQDFRYLSLCVDLMHFSKSQFKNETAVNLGTEIAEKCDKFPKNFAHKTVLDLAGKITADGAAVMGALAAVLKKPYQHCLGHRIQLALKSFTLSEERLCVTVGVATRIASYVRRSTFAADNIGCRFVTHTKTRFNSYLLCVRSIVSKFPQLKAFVNRLPASERIKNHVIDFEILLPEALASIFLLEQVAQASANLTADSVTSTDAILIIGFLKKSLKATETSFETMIGKFSWISTISETKKNAFQTNVRNYSESLISFLNTRYIFFCLFLFIIIIFFIIIF